MYLCDVITAKACVVPFDMQARQYRELTVLLPAHVHVVGHLHTEPDAADQRLVLQNRPGVRSLATAYIQHAAASNRRSSQAHTSPWITRLNMHDDDQSDDCCMRWVQLKTTSHLLDSRLLQGLAALMFADCILPAHSWAEHTPQAWFHTLAVVAAPLETRGCWANVSRWPVAGLQPPHMRY